MSMFWEERGSTRDKRECKRERKEWREMEGKDDEQLEGERGTAQEGGRIVESEQAS